MFGTVGHLKVKAGKLDEFLALANDPVYATIEGYRSAQALVDENVPGHVVLAVWFDDRDSYVRNAEDPAQDARYRKMRELLEEDPTWTDGEWVGAPSG